MKVSEFKLDSFSGDSLRKSLQKDYWVTMKQSATLVLPQFTISEIGITHRWITHWDNQGLLGSKRNGSGWRRFSFVDYIWLRIIVHLREFHLPLSAIKQVKKFLWEPTSQEEIESGAEDYLQMVKNGELPIPLDMTFEKFEKWYKLEVSKTKKTGARQLNRLFWIIFAMQLYERPFCLFIGQDGECGSIFFGGDGMVELGLSALTQQIGLADFICLNLYRILHEFFSNEKIKEEVIQKIALLNDKEKQILELIQKDDFKEISIKLNDNKEYIVGIKRNKSVDKITNEVSSIINRSKYQDIKLVTHKGKIILAEVTEKLKI